MKITITRAHQVAPAIYTHMLRLLEDTEMHCAVCLLRAQWEEDPERADLFIKQAVGWHDQYQQITLALRECVAIN